MSEHALPSPKKARTRSAVFPLRVVEVACEPSDALLRASAMLGMALAPQVREHGASISRHLLQSIFRQACGGALVLVTGPSGSGKSTLLAQLADLSERRGMSVCSVPRRSKSRAPIIDLLDGPLESRLGILARAGLAESSLLAQSPSTLSEGQHARFLLARAMHRAERTGARWLFADEFASTLDRVTARALAWTVSRWAKRRSYPRTLVVASAHEDLARHLRPDLVITCSLDGSIQLSPD